MIDGGIIADSFADIKEEIERAVREGTSAAVAEFPRLITDQLKVGLKPDGSPQPANSQRTADAKYRRGVGAVPGVDSGVLADPSKWTVEETADGLDVRPPRERDAALDALDALDYDFVGVPVGGEELIEAEINAALEGVK